MWAVAWFWVWVCLCWVCGLVVDYGLWVGDELGFWGLVWGFCGLFGCDVRLGVLGVGLVACVV